MSDPVTIIGAGLAGLSCARELKTHGVECVVLEASDGVGGRVRTDSYEGFLLDRGFQVLLTAYPECRRLLNYEALKLKPFYPGAMVRFEGKFHHLADPGGAVRSARHPAPRRDDRVPAADRGRVQPVRVHHRHLGERVRTTDDRARLAHHAADVPGRAFYSIDMLPQPWRTVSLFNPVVYLVSGFRWSFFGKGDVSVGISLGVTAVFLVLCLGVIALIFRTGWRLKN